jgi:hypothetical protein
MTTNGSIADPPRQFPGDSVRDGVVDSSGNVRSPPLAPVSGRVNPARVYRPET